MKKISVQMLVQMAFLVALQVVLSRFLSVSTPVAKIGFGFVPVALAAVCFGAPAGFVVGGLADFLGAILFPIGPYFPGFTLTAALIGVVYGVFLHRKFSWQRVILAVLVISVVFSLGMNTVWISVLYGQGFWALIPGRLLQVAVMIPVQVIVILPMRRVAMLMNRVKA